jgi:hypothetical protein
MSNLTLPVMTYDNLSHVLGGRWHKQVAYATSIERVGSAIYVKHHENVIAVLEPDSVYVTKCGWDSDTTANRLRKILSDNRVPFTVRIRQYSMYLLENFKDRNGVPFDRATFTRTENGWNLA